MSVIETVKTYLGVQPANDIRDVLHKDHEEILSLARDMAEARTADKRMSYYAALKPLLTAHARAEEKVVYVPMSKAKGEESRDLANEGFVEHSLVDVLMERMGKPGVAGSDGWKAHAQVLKELLEHHIKEEQGEVFSTLQKKFSDPQRQAMAVDFIAEKARLTKAKRSPKERQQG